MPCWVLSNLGDVKMRYRRPRPRLPHSRAGSGGDPVSLLRTSLDSRLRGNDEALVRLHFASANDELKGLLTLCSTSPPASARALRLPSASCCPTPPRRPCSRR